jgi:hypothetical protein
MNSGCRYRERETDWLAVQRIYSAELLICCASVACMLLSLFPSNGCSCGAAHDVEETGK